MHRSVRPGPDGWAGPQGRGTQDYGWEPADPGSDPGLPAGSGYDWGPESDFGLAAGPDYDWDPAGPQGDPGYRGGYGYGWVPGGPTAPRPPGRPPRRGPSRAAPSRDRQPRGRATERGEGAGLGLAIANSIVRSTAGQWRIGDSPPGGAFFAVTWRRAAVR